VFKIGIKRICRIKAPYDIVAHAANDWSHFMHLHHKSIANFQLLFKSGDRNIFLYKARILYPFPFFNYFLIFREDNPKEESYRNIYLDLKSGAKHYLIATVSKDGEYACTVGEYVFTQPEYWRYFHGLFFKLFKWRMRRLMAEDNIWLKERMAVGCFDNPQCAPVIPTAFDLCEDIFREGLPKADIHYEDMATEDFGGPERKP
jgi:hypothetical protein